MKSCRCMAHYFSSDLSNILLCVRIGSGYKSIVKPIRFWCIVWLTRCSHVCTLQSTANVFKREVVCRRFFRFWLIFPNRNYHSRSIEYKFNWCWYFIWRRKHSLSLKICSKHQEHQRRYSIFPTPRNGP